MIGTFKKLSCDRKLGLYLSLLTSLVLRIFFRSEFHIKQIEEVI